MEIKRKHFVSAAVFAALIVVLTAFFSWLFYPRNNFASGSTDAISGNTLLGEPKGTIDVLFVGDSQAFESISPLGLWQNKGITSFISGTGGQPVCEMPDFVKAAFKNQSLSLVVLEADTVFTPCSVSKYAYTRLKEFVPLLQYHDRWKLIGTPAFTIRENFTNTDEWKGYHFDDEIKPFSGDLSNTMSDSPDGFEEYGKAAELSVKDIAGLCRKNGADFLIISVPNLAWSNARHNSIQTLADGIGVPYYDMNLSEAAQSIAWTGEDAQDYGEHVNCYGAVKVTEFLGRYLYENYVLPDRRNDAACAPWADSAKMYADSLKG